MRRESLENCSDPCQHFVHERRRQLIYFPGVAGRQIEYAGLIASHHASGFSPGQRYSEAKATSKVTAIRDGQNDR
ncbi:hypothetical protein FACS189497_07480 [Betaproteobacteria bacterium]|nr:hypothetical protein FACS189497_07480 [Betaproteobacteria bacterium]